MTVVESAPSNVVGIDVSKATLVVFDQTRQTLRTVGNEPEAIARLVASFDPGTLVVCEPTGGHEAPLISELMVQGVACHRADTLKVQAFIKSFGRLAKTDAIDAMALAQYGEERWKRLPLFQPKDKVLSDLAALVARRDGLMAFKIAETNRLKAPCENKTLARSFKIVITCVQRQIDRIDEEIETLMDEFPALGKMDSFSQGFTTLRSYGGRMMIVAQSISNLKAAYGNDGAQNFLANCRLQSFIAPADADTPEYVSKSIGDFTRKSRSKSWQMNKFGGTNISERQEGTRLFRPEDLRRLSDDEVVLLIQGQDAVRAKKVIYYKDRALKKVFEGQTGPLPVPPVVIAASNPKAQVLKSLSDTANASSAGEASRTKAKRLKSPPQTVQNLSEQQADELLSEQNSLLSLISDIQRENLAKV